MTSRAFFSLTLVLPLIAGVLGLLVPALRILVVSILFAGVPYLLFAALLLILIRRAPTKTRLVRLSLTAPLLFLPLILLFVLIAGGSEAAYSAPIGDIVSDLLPVAVYGLVFGYIYVGLAWGLWAIARALGIVRDEFAT